MNTANITTSYLWFALTFWVYLETRKLIATGVIYGAYMLLIALSSISFGTFVDRYRKFAVMRFAAGFTLVMFSASYAQAAAEAAEKAASPAPDE
ncbi:UNVERIFIED_ORG: MFS family permease [Arthrobacter sp. UYEF2]